VPRLDPGDAPFTVVVESITDGCAIDVSAE
jgi:hypothetical protein